VVNFPLDLSRYDSQVPAGLLRELERHVNDRCPVAWSTQNMLENNFIGAVRACDDVTYPVLRTVARIIYNELPSLCHGSPERVRDWLRRKEAA
jgi:hypothetical protein